MFISLYPVFLVFIMFNHTKTRYESKVLYITLFNSIHNSSMYEGGIWSLLWVF